MEILDESLSWVIGGPQGSGVDSSANLYAKALAFGGLWVFGKREYYSNIMGEHSYFQVRAHTRQIYSHLDYIHILATFEEETLIRHAWDVIPGGCILYDPRYEEHRLEKTPTLEKIVLESVTSRLAQQNLPLTVGGVLAIARDNGARLIPLPYQDLQKKVSEEFPEAKAQILGRLSNTMAVAGSLELLGFPLDYLEKSIADVFKGKSSIVKMNVRAAHIAAEYIRELGISVPWKLTPQAAGGKRLYMNGNQALALGKIFGGCTIQTYYPITPASDESVFLEENELVDMLKAEDLGSEGWAGNPGANGASRMPLVVLQTEDEIAAITAAIGAGIAGARAATATSGPGFCLMAEGLGWAGMNEVPVVVTNYQRAGPSTGLPTRHEQGDLLFSVFYGHGDSPRIVLSSGDIEEYFVDAILAHNYADRYQCPVIHLVDKAGANCNATIPYFDLGCIRISRGKLLDGPIATSFNENGYLRFAYAKDGISERIRLGTPGAAFWNTGDEHTEEGHITEDPTTRTLMMEKRMRKLQTALQEIPASEKLNIFGDPEGEWVIVSWGSTKGVLVEATEYLQSRGHKVKFVQARLIWPFPRDEMLDATASARVLIDVEMNFEGQYARLFRDSTLRNFDYYVVKYNGRPISFNEVVAALQSIIAGKAKRRIVLTHGH
ncbi:MAG: 2-oxoacid:acceptor oxidoreductase family protein [bacterium JZ-2024 1]